MDVDANDAIGEREQARSLRAPSSEPSLNHRAASGGQHRSPSRKRPRLDSGSRTARSKSADRALSTSSKAASTDTDSTMQDDSRPATPAYEDTSATKSAITPSRVTINVREHPKGNITPPVDDHRDSSGGVKADEAVNGMTGKAKPKNSSTSSSTSPQSDSSPVIEVAVPDSEDADDVVTEIRLDDENDEDRIASLFYHFPYSTDGHYCEAAELISDELEKGLNFDVLLHLDKWIQDLQRCVRHGSGDWSSVFYEHSAFWETIAKIYTRMFNKSILKHNAQLSADVVETFARSFLRTFANLLARVIQIDTTFFSEAALEVERLGLLSTKFVTAGKALLRDDKGFLAKILPLFDVDAHELRAYVIKCFVQAQGPRHLSRFIRLNFQAPYREESFLPKAIICIQYAQSFAAFTVFYLGRQEGLSQPLSDHLAENLLEIFDATGKQLMSFLDKQQDVLTLDMRRNFLEYQTNILGSVFQLVPHRAGEIFKHVTERELVGLEDHYKLVAALIWKLKLSITYITKGRMDLRLNGIDMMAKELVDFFNHNKEKINVLRSSNPGSHLTFVADFLLSKRILQYLFGVASHPQLITRSSNVIGFLVVTNNFTKEQADLIWRTITDSPDPRVVAATFPVFANLVKQLADFEENMMVCEIIMSGPLPFMSPQAAEFLLDLLGKIRQQSSDSSHFRSEPQDERFYRVPLELCVELIRLLSPTKPQTVHAQLVYDHACEALGSLAAFANPEVRKKLFEKCIGIIQESPDDGAAAAQSIYLMLRHIRAVPSTLSQELRLLPVLVNDFCQFVATQRNVDARFTMPQLNIQLWPRLDLIWFAMPYEEGNADEQLIKKLWSHAVGSDAISNTARDVAWHRLSMITFNPGMDNSFLERHQELLSPTQIEPSFFTSGFFSFIQKLATSRMRAQAAPELNEDGTIDIPGLDLLWDAILRAPKNVGDDSSLQYLIARYLDDSWLQRTSKEAVEATHIALVDESINRLKKAHEILRISSTDAINGIDSGTGVLMPATSREEAEITFIRMVKFLKKFLIHVRTMKEHRSKATEVIDLSESTELPIYRGSMISIKCEIMRQGQRAVSRTLVMGTLDTCKQLYRRICTLLGDYNVASFQLIGNGRRLYLREQPRMTLEDVGIARAPHLILREGASGEEARKDYIVPAQQWRSAFEQRLVDSLEIFYNFLDSTDPASAATFDMLRSLPRYQALKEVVSNKDIAAEDLFPANQPFKVAYSLECLRELLEAGPTDPAFIVHGTRLLESLLPSDEAIAERVSLHLDLVADTVSCLYDFYAAGESKKSDMFSDDASVVRRIVGLCVLGIPAAKTASLAWDSYDLAFELVSSSETAWQEFTRNAQVSLVHEHLLLVHPEAPVRRDMSQLLRRKLEHWPTSSHISLPTLLMFLWSHISSMIPKAIPSPQRAAETFDVAILLFRSLLKFRTFTLEQVEDLFNAWTPLLVNYVHHEQVGRDEVDVVLRGLAMLMRLATEAVPTILLTDDKINLMQTIWWKFLFQPNPRSHEDVARLAIELPALESDTRTELIQFISTLATDDDTVDALCDLFGDVTIQHKFNSQIDKSGLLKSSAGFVGLKNLGQTCYMNSLVTQLFMNPVFRAFILSCAPLTREADSPLLFETQKLFATMQNTYRGYSTAEDFTRKIVTLTEEIIDVREQMDVDEFMNTLFHRWEEQMPSTELKARLRSVYTGKTVQQIKSKECEHVSEREDTCLAIPCDIQGNASLEDSLKAYVQGDVMEGDNKYKCERCDRLVDAVKRTCLKDIPNHLMLQLKRFAFDLETYSRNKINDHFSFPMAIDMSRYTFEHLANPDEPINEDLFELVGVIVHKGQAEHGHYVSYIRARPSIDGEAPSWLLFDDSDVTVFDPKEFPEACFGGVANKDASIMFQGGLKSYNAYMLFYQRRSTLQDHPWAPEGAANLQSVPVMPDVEAEINDDNRVLLRDYSLFDDSSREFVRNLLKMLEQIDHSSHDHELQTKILSLVWRYLASIWARTKELPDFEEALVYLRQICTQCDQCCYISLRWLINSRRSSLSMMEDEDVLRDLILRINQPKVRQLIRVFILASLKQLRLNSDMYGADVTDSEPNSQGNGAIAIVTRLAQFIPDSLHMNFRAWEEYFGLLADIGALGPQESYTLIVDGALTACFEALLFNMGYTDTVDRKYQFVIDSLKRKIGPPCNQLIRLASILFNYINMSADSVSEVEPLQRLQECRDGGVPWTDHEELLLLDFNKKEGGLVWLCEIFQKWNFDTEDFQFAPGEVVRMLLSAKSAVVHGVVETFMISIKDFESRYADPFLRSTKLIPMYLKDREVIDKFAKFIRTCSRDVNGTSPRGDDGYNGTYCLRFWSALHQIAMGNLASKLDDPAFFDRTFLDHCRDWAPSLLVYRKDWDVGRNTQRLVQEAVFKAYDKLNYEDIRDGIEHDYAVSCLFWGCDRQIRMLYGEQPWRQFMAPLVNVMADCVEHTKLIAIEDPDRDPDSVAEDEKILGRFDEVKTWFDELPSRTDEDLALAQSSELNEEWQALDIADDAFAEASDLTEVSDDDLGAVLTTDLDA